MVARRWSSHHDTLQITSPPIGSAAPIQPLAEGGAPVLVERGMVERRRQRLGIMRHIHQPCLKHRAEPAARRPAARLRATSRCYWSPARRARRTRCRTPASTRSWASSPSCPRYPPLAFVISPDSKRSILGPDPADLASQPCRRCKTAHRRPLCRHYCQSRQRDFRNGKGGFLSAKRFAGCFLVTEGCRQ